MAGMLPVNTLVNVIFCFFRCSFFPKITNNEKLGDLFRPWAFNVEIMTAHTVNPLTYS